MERVCIFPRKGSSSTCIVSNVVPDGVAGPVFVNYESAQEFFPPPEEPPTSFALMMFNQSKHVQGYLRDGKITAAQGSTIIRTAEPAVNASPFLHSNQRTTIGKGFPKKASKKRTFEKAGLHINANLRERLRTSAFGRIEPVPPFVSSIIESDEVLHDNGDFNPMIDGTTSSISSRPPDVPVAHNVIARQQVSKRRRCVYPALTRIR